VLAMINRLRWLGFDHREHLGRKDSPATEFAHQVHIPTGLLANPNTWLRPRSGPCELKAFI
jgi:hypothetical protein